MEIKNQNKYQVKNDKFIVKNPVKSAQFSRSFHNKNFYPFSRIKRVDDIIQANKKLKESTRLPETDRAPLKLPKTIAREERAIS